MIKILKVSPSTHPAKTVDELLNYAKKLQEAKADFLHCDVMDGLFVEDKTYSYELVQLLNDNCVIPLDVHLMMIKPEKVVEQFAKAGANIITVHYESFKTQKQLVSCLNLIKTNGALCGVSIKPSTSVLEVIPVLHMCDFVLVMSVEPGKSGQAFMHSALNKIEELAEFRTQEKLYFYIEVDGGVNADNVSLIKESGADIVVSGNYLYNSLDLQTAINSLR